MAYRGVGPQSARSERRDERRRMQAEQRKRARPDYVAWLATLEKPSEIAARHERDNDDDQAKMERGECCGRCSSSGMCGSGRWGWLWIHYGSGQCPQSKYERGITNWLKAILGDDYEQYCGDGPEEEKRTACRDDQRPAETARGAG